MTNRDGSSSHQQSSRHKGRNTTPLQGRLPLSEGPLPASSSFQQAFKSSRMRALTGTAIFITSELFCKYHCQSCTHQMFYLGTKTLLNQTQRIQEPIKSGLTKAAILQDLQEPQQRFPGNMQGQLCSIPPTHFQQHGVGITPGCPMALKHSPAQELCLTCCSYSSATSNLSELKPTAPHPGEAKGTGTSAQWSEIPTDIREME